MGQGSGWFEEARFGMFIHWTHIANRGFELSWPLVGGVGVLPFSSEVTVDDYYMKALEFHPAKDAPREWMRLAREAGMRYAVLTTKHHDGFALWPSKYGDFNISRTSYDGDLVAEYVDAARAEGLEVGFYYSLSDWHHPDYPAFREEDKPYLKFLGRRSETWDRYLDVLFGQVRELLTNYGEISVMWFDGQWERSRDEWKAGDLAQMIRDLQPGILINDRLPGGDYKTPEQAIPAEVPDGVWETCMTMNTSWGFVPTDDRYKSSRELVHTLCETAGKGGNLLLNVSPRADGSLPAEQVSRLQDLARWMSEHGDAIHGTEPGLEPWQFYGPSTRNGNTINLFCVMRPYEGVVVRGVPIKRVRCELPFRTRATAEQELGNPDPIGEVFIEVPDVDELATVVQLEIV